MNRFLRRLRTVEEDYDFVVVGAGSAGCIVAARLSENGKHRVLLLEAGPSDKSFWLQVPMGYGRSFYDPRLNWMYMSEPAPGLGGRQVYVPRGKVLGGSSAINAMVYSRGQPSDFDAWQQLGNPGWGWDDLLSAYRRMEDHELGPSALHGRGGPVHVTEISAASHPLTRVFLEAGPQIGVPFNPDLNSDSIEGVGLYQITTAHGQRLSAARAYLWPARRRSNLRVLTEALVTRIKLDGSRAEGVLYDRAGAVCFARARREIIVAAGAINTPQLLELSGLGPADHLKALGIEVRKDMPAVGANLQDHICYDHVYHARVPSLNDELRPWHGKLKAGADYLLRRRGPLGLSLNQAGGFIRSRPDLSFPDVQLYFSPLSYEKIPPGTRALMSPDPFSGFSMSISPCRPTSRGHIAVRAPDPWVAPAIHLNLLGTDEDCRIALEGAKFLRRLAATPALQSVTSEELRPGPKAASDADLLADIRATAYSVFHPVGTCRMGPDPQRDVVDHRLRVHGLSALRIIDASIFPIITSGNTNAPAMMVGEKGAEMLLADSAP